VANLETNMQNITLIIESA